MFAATSIVYTFETYDDSPFDRALADAVVIAEFVANLFFLASAVLYLRAWCVYNGAENDAQDEAGPRSMSEDLFENSYRAFSDSDSVELRTRGIEFDPAAKIEDAWRTDSSSDESGACECCPDACACALMCDSANLKSFDFLESVPGALYSSFHHHLFVLMA